MKRVLVTGVTGFIGRHCVAPLKARGYEIHAISSRGPRKLHPDIQWYHVDLRHGQQIPALIAKIQPTHLLHFAWYVAPGKWETTGVHDNFLWVQASLELLRHFYSCGGKRVVFAGSCMEYDLQYGYCSELATPTKPHTFYGTCKSALQTLFTSYAAEVDLSNAWGRIFFVYGPHEHPTRLVSSVICSLLRGETARCTHGNQLRDYLHVQDVADAFVALLESDVRGPVNIASGCPVPLKDIVYTIARKLCREDLIGLGAIPAAAHEAPFVAADVRRLCEEVRWRPQYELDRGLEHTIYWWKKHIGDGETGKR